MHAIPRMSPVSQMIDPTAFPRASPASPCTAASTETTASGVVVPRLTTVAPTITLGTPHCMEMATASSTSTSAPFPRARMLTAIVTASAQVGHRARSVSRYSGTSESSHDVPPRVRMR